MAINFIDKVFGNWIKVGDLQIKVTERIRWGRDLWVDTWIHRGGSYPHRYLRILTLKGI